MSLYIDQVWIKSISIDAFGWAETDRSKSKDIGDKLFLSRDIFPYLILASILSYAISINVNVMVKDSIN